MNRLVATGLGLIIAVMISDAFAQSSTQKELDRAKAAYQAEKSAYRASILEAFEKREEAARKAADKKLVDQIKAEQDAFENWQAIPANVSPAVSKRRSSSRARMEAAFNAAIKSAVRAKNDAVAAAIETELKSFQNDNWPHLDLEKATSLGETFQIGKFSGVYTIAEFSGPIEIIAIARTEKDNIRLRGPRGSCVIFNWEGQSGQMRVARPDGNDQTESGSIAAAIQQPLKPGSWYKLQWRLTSKGMQIFVNDQVAFSEEKPYDLTSKSRIEIRAESSLVEVRDFHVIPLDKE